MSRSSNRSRIPFYAPLWSLEPEGKVVKRSIGWALLSLALAGATAPLFAATDAQVIEKLRATLKERYPNVKIDAIRNASEVLPGMYEIETDGKLAYVDAHGDRIFTGTVVDTKTKQELTSKRLSELSRISFDDLPLDQAFKTVKGDGSRVVAIFEDPLCPYCRQLEQSMVDVTNVTIYTFLYPIESIHPGATEKAKRIWCATDPAEAWTDWMLKKKEPAASECKKDASAALAELAKIGDKFKISGTPTLFFVDGHRDPGFLPADKLEKELDGSKLSLAAATTGKALTSNK